MIIDLVKYPVLTEKSVLLIENAQYTFDVDLKLNKLQIKKLIQDLFQVNVIAVNTHRPPRKKKALGSSKGYKARYKRVIITLKSGDAIPLLPETEKTD
jgi:large subunit ribosomal protein L23